MINDAIFRNKLYAVVRKYILPEAKIIFAEQAEARPQKPYCTLKLISGPVRVGHDIERVSQDEFVEVAGVREFVYSINYYGENALQELSRLQTSFQFPTARELFLQVGMVYVQDEAAPRDLTILQENKFESRAQMDVRFRANGSLKDLDREVIETAILVSEIDNTETIINP